jgi:hypothetical protein
MLSISSWYPEDVLCLVVPCRLARTTYSLIPPVAFDCGGVELHIGEVVLGTASAQRNRGRASNAVLTGPHQHNPHIRPTPLRRPDKACQRK